MIVLVRKRGDFMKLGFHMPFSGSLTSLAKKIEVSRGNTFQIYSRSMLGITRKGEVNELHPIKRKQMKEFNAFLDERGIEPIHVHGGYALNLTREYGVTKIKEEIDYKKIVIEDLNWAEHLGASYYILQPGYSKGINEFEAMETLKENLAYVIDNSKFNGRILIKNMAGSGTEMAKTLEEWNELITFHERILGVLDFARLYSAGYDFTTKKGAKKVYEEIENIVGWEKIKTLYLNDTNKLCGEKKQASNPPPLGEGNIGFSGYEEILKFKEIQKKNWLVENQPNPLYYDETIDFLKSSVKEGE